jgi:hypothetical protein
MVFARGLFMEAIDGFVDKGGEGCPIGHAPVKEATTLASSVTSATEGDCNGEWTAEFVAREEYPDNKGGSNGVLAWGSPSSMLSRFAFSMSIGNALELLVRDP